MGAKLSIRRRSQKAQEKPDVPLVEKSSLKSDDIESSTSNTKEEVPVTVLTRLAVLAVPAVLTLYAVIALGKNVLTKKILSYYGFPYPLTLSTLSCILTALACVPFQACYPSVLKLPSKSAARGILLVSLLTGVDMVLSNLSLNRISLSLQQVIKATQVIWVLVFEITMQNKRPSTDIWLYVLLMVVGAPITAIGSASEDFNLFGCLLMVAATLTGALKYVTAHDVIRANKKELGSIGFIFWLEISMLLYLVPWTFLTDEITRPDGVIAWIKDTATSADYIALVINSLLGGFRAYVQFLVLRLCSALQLVFTNIVLQSLVVILGIFLFHNEQSELLWIGIALTLVGYTAYSVRLALAKKETKH